MNEQAIINTIKELEAERCRALVEGNLDALSQLVDDQLVHIHATGQVDNKHGYLQLVETAIRFLKVERPDLQVRIYADVAVATGRLSQSIEFCSTGERRELDVITTQIWALRDSRWRQISFQATSL